MRFAFFALISLLFFPHGAHAADPYANTQEDEVTPPASYTIGTLLKLADSSAVYILGDDGKRHAFPSEIVFSSWNLSFDDVVTVDASAMAAFPLGANVTVRPGTYLVKLQTNPKVYAIEPGGMLRWVASEAVAIQLYGADWADRIIDVSDAFWANYTVGEAIDTTIHPDGTLVLRSGNLYFVSDATKAQLTGDEVATYRFDEAFAVVGVDSSIFSQYLAMDASLILGDSAWPF